MSNKTVDTNNGSNQEDQKSTTPAPETKDWHEMRRAAREARHEARRKWRAENHTGWRASSYPWFGGVILILLGIIFLLRDTMGLYLENWWALFILFPAFGAFINAWNVYQRDGQLNWFARRSVMAGVILTLIAAVFLFNLNWAWIFPIILILIGVGILINAILPK